MRALGRLRRRGVVESPRAWPAFDVSLSCRGPDHHDLRIGDDPGAYIAILPPGGFA